MSENTKPDSLSIVVFSGAFDKVHYALTMASAAAATNMPATLFFTMQACRALLKESPNGTWPWQTMPVSESRETAGAMDQRFAAREVATFEELMTSCAELGVRFMVCEMGLRALGLACEDLRGDIAFEEGGVVTFLNGASRDGAMLFV